MHMENNGKQVWDRVDIVVKPRRRRFWQVELAPLFTWALIIAFCAVMLALLRYFGGVVADELFATSNAPSCVATAPETT